MSGAVDYEAVIWINDAYVCSHQGGFDAIRIRPDLGNESVTVDLLISRPTTKRTLGVKITIR